MMTDAATLFGLCAAVLVGLGVYGLIVDPQPLRKILAFNVVGNGVFMMFGAVAHRGAGAGWGGDPVPQALLITGLVVAFCATALAIAVLLRLFDETGSATLASDVPPPRDAAGGLCPPIQSPSHLVTPAKAGVQAICHRRTTWIPAFAGMTCFSSSRFPPTRIGRQSPAGDDER